MDYTPLVVCGFIAVAFVVFVVYMTLKESRDKKERATEEQKKAKIKEENILEMQRIMFDIFEHLPSGKSTTNENILAYRKMVFFHINKKDYAGFEEDTKRLGIVFASCLFLLSHIVTYYKIQIMQFHKPQHRFIENDLSYLIKELYAIDGADKKLIDDLQQQFKQMIEHAEAQSDLKNIISKLDKMIEQQEE